MVSKLKFKGERQKKRKRHDADADAQGSSRDGGVGSEGWVNATSLDDIGSGPLFIVFSSSPPVALSHGGSGNVLASVIKSVRDGGALEDNAEPDDVPQVWIATRLAHSDKISLKTPHNKFLSCDKVGLLSVSKEAIGAQEEWRPIQTTDGWALQNVYEKFLSVNEIAAGGKVEIRGDADSVEGETESSVVDAERTKTFKERARENSLTDEQVKMLRQAKKDGRMAGALLDIRTKTKSDKYA